MARLGGVIVTFCVCSLMLLASACSNSSAADGPPDINYGRDVCFECGMIISEERFASAYRLPDGTEKVFDDVGEMLKHGQSTGEIHSAEAWVHDYETEAWVAADKAHYIVTRSVATPMAFGIISFEDPARADRVARDLGADVVDWETILMLPPRSSSIEESGKTGDEDLDGLPAEAGTSTGHGHYEEDGP